MLAPPYPAGQFPPDTGTPPVDWQQCWPKNGALSPTSYARCNATQTALVQGFRKAFIAAAAPAIDAKSPHGIFADSCPNQHCQTSTGWNRVKVSGGAAGVSTTMADAAARWYFQNTTEKHVDTPFPSNDIKSCGFRADGSSASGICSNCANAGIGSNCLWDAQRQSFHGIHDLDVRPSAT